MMLGSSTFSLFKSQIWNDLPENIPNVTSTASFNKKVKTSLYAKVYTPQ